MAYFVVPKRLFRGTFIDMTIILCDISALEFWRSDDTAARRQPARGSVLRKYSSLFTKPNGKQIEALLRDEFPFLSEPVHVLVPDAASRPKGARVRSHIRPAQLPRNSFIQIGEDMFACRPELSFIQRANGQSLAREILDGLELCGAYRRSVGDRPTRYQVYPLTNIADLTSFVSKAGSVYGVVAARQALRYIDNGSESPMESILVVLFCLPVRLGGYGLPLPNLNFRVPTSDFAKRTTGRNSFRCDLLWPEAKLAVEYDGYENHNKLEDRSSDGSRHAALVGMGFQTIRITRENVKNVKDLDAIAASIAKKLGMRVQPTKRNWSAKKDQLRNDVLPWIIPLP